MFGWHPRLAIDAFLGITPDTLSSTKSTEYVRKLRQRLDFAYRKAQEQAKKTGAVYKQHYDETARSSVLMPGDMVLVQKVGVKGKHKIGDKWEHDPYILISQPDDDILVMRFVGTIQEQKRQGCFIAFCFFLLLAFLAWVKRILRRILIVWLWLGVISRIRLYVKLTLVTLKCVQTLKTLCCLRMMILQTMKRLRDWMAQVKLLGQALG